MDINEVINQFDLVEAKLRLLEELLGKLRLAAPRAVAGANGSAAHAEYERLRQDYARQLQWLRPCEGWVASAVPLGIDDPALTMVAPARATHLCLAEAVEQLREYRARFAVSRLDAARSRLQQLVALIDAEVAHLVMTHPPQADRVAKLASETLNPLSQLIAELDRLTGTKVPGQHWSQLYRHLHFACDVDVTSIAQSDWPGVRKEVAALLESRREPQVNAADLASLAAVPPRGKAVTALNWPRLDDDSFERLLFALLSDAAGYEKVEWLMKTNAPDRGRDVSAWRVRADDLADVDRERVIVQCKHWPRRSVSPTDVADVLAKVTLWEPPPVDILIIATTGRFTADAVKKIEDHNGQRTRPRIEMWPDSMLERLINRRPHLVADFNLRWVRIHRDGAKPRDSGSLIAVALSGSIGCG